MTGVEDLNSNTIVNDPIGLTNMGAFLYKGLMWKGLMGLHMRQLDVQLAALANNHGTLHHVAQLADISGPGVALH